MPPQLVRGDGESYYVGPVKKGTDVEVFVDAKAPDTPGPFKYKYRFLADRYEFGDAIWIKLNAELPQADMEH